MYNFQRRSTLLDCFSLDDHRCGGQRMKNTNNQGAGEQYFSLGRR